MTIDLRQARRETPGCENVLHFNNAGASLAPEPVLKTVINHLQLEAQIGGYEAADQASPALEHVYDAVASLLNCQRQEVAIIENATRAWDMAFYSIPFGPKDRILTSVAEYASNYIPFLQVARKTGAIIEVIPNDETGQLSVEALRDMLDEQVKLIAITHVPSNGGLVNPAAEVGKVAREAGILYLLDACQSVGQMPIDVEEIGCDFLSATGRKYLRAPRGTGFLYVRNDVMDQVEPPMLDLHSAIWVERNRYELRPDARRFENWETNVAAKLGLGAALDYALQWGLDEIKERIKLLSSELRALLNDLKAVTVQDLGKEQCGIVSFSVVGKDPEIVRQMLGEHKINVSVTRAGSTLIDMERRGLVSMVRASVHYYNSEQEVERFFRVLSAIV